MASAEELQSFSNYRKIKGISRGGFGFIDLCEHTVTNELVAIKFIERGERVTKRTERQILQHQALVHPHVVHLIEVFLTPSHLAIVMEYVEGGTLLDYVKKVGKIDEDEARWYFQQLMIALDYLHRKEIASRDMKLQNVLMCGEESQRPLLKVTGFGHAKHERFHSAPASLVGTAEYLSPEVIRSAGKKAYNGRAADVWAMGVILFRLVAGRYPFERLPDQTNPHCMNSLAKRVCNAEYHIPSDVEIAPEFEELLRGMLEPDWQRRMTVKDILHHPWFAEGLPPGVVDMNARLPDGPSPSHGQPVLEVKQTLKDARIAVAPVHVWDDSDFIEDHQLHGMDEDELQDFIDSIMVPGEGIASH